ncbi:hypothetical protein [Synechococcus sp. CBW1002]|uniref:hypothetical protein n=2 Tax=Synechococcus TaxID=1129 RepID=UPI001E4B81F6|nr:hypothetical protein [Synechococcus sp. CBW1002]
MVGGEQHGGATAGADDPETAWQAGAGACSQISRIRSGCGTVTIHSPMLVPNDSKSIKSVIAGLLVLVGAIGGLALLVWFTVVLLDLKHLNTSGFTLP